MKYINFKVNIDETKIGEFSLNMNFKEINSICELYGISISFNKFNSRIVSLPMLNIDCVFDEDGVMKQISTSNVLFNIQGVNIGSTIRDFERVVGPISENENGYYESKRTMNLIFEVEDDDDDDDAELILEKRIYWLGFLRDTHCT